MVRVVLPREEGAQPPAREIGHFEQILQGIVRRLQAMSTAARAKAATHLVEGVAEFERGQLDTERELKLAEVYMAAAKDIDAEISRIIADVQQWNA